MCLQAIHCHASDLSACAFGELYMVPRSDDTRSPESKASCAPKSSISLEGLKLGEWDIFPQLSQCLNVPRTAVWVTRIKLFVFLEKSFVKSGALDFMSVLSVSLVLLLLGLLSSSSSSSPSFHSSCASLCFLDLLETIFDPWHSSG